MSLTRRFLFVAAMFLYFFPGAFACAQSGPAYTSIVIFGDSLSDTGNDAILSAAANTVNAQVPGPATDYTLGRFTDGTDTAPAARNYNGVWVEQLAAKLAAKPTVKNSLSGGTDYAYGFGTTDVGTSVFTYGPGNVLSFTVENMGHQVDDYLATHPVITSQTLFVVWGGANDLIAATSSADIVNAATRDVGIVQRLIAAGATDIIVPNLPPLGLVPRFNGSATTSLTVTGAAQGFDQALAAGLAGLAAANPGKTLHIFPLDTFTLFNTIVGPPIAGGFANVTASSQGNTTVNPDTYLFWDDLHPTTYGHSLIAAAAFTLIGTPVVTTTTVTSNNLNANQNAPVTLTASVAATSGTPIGTVTFFDGSTALGTGFLSAGMAANTAVASFSTSALTAATHTITASYSGVNGYVSSTSPAVSEVVTAPAFSASLPTSTVTVVYGGAGTATLTVTPVGGFTGTATFACGTLPAHFACTFANTTLTLGSNAPVSTTVAITTATVTAAVAIPARPGAKLSEVFAAFTVFPCLGFMGMAAFRRRQILGKSVGMLVLFAMLSAGALLGMSGCSGGSSTNPNYAAPGTYSVPVNVTANGMTKTTTLTVIVN